MKLILLKKDNVYIENGEFNVVSRGRPHFILTFIKYGILKRYVVSG